MEPGSRTLAEAIAFMVIYIGALWFYAAWAIIILLDHYWHHSPTPPDIRD